MAAKGMNKKAYNVKHVNGTQFLVTFKFNGDYFTKGAEVIDLARKGEAHCKLCEYTTSYYSDCIIDAATEYLQGKDPAAARSISRW